MNKPLTFEELIEKLSHYWRLQGCTIHQGYDLELGAATLNPTTFLRSLGKEPYSAAYVEGCRRPSDGRYGENPNRLQHYYQYQVIFKPSPLNLQELYLNSLTFLGIDLKKHDIRFVQDDWENPTVGAWGLGWEVWMDGMEVTQFTYFQGVGSQPLFPVTGELTIGLERLAMYLQNKDNIFDVQFNERLSYGDLFHQNEVEFSCYNFELADEKMWLSQFDQFEKECVRLLNMNKNLSLPAYEFVMKCSHAFNILDARGVISVTERASYIARIRNLARRVAENYLLEREKINYPLLKKLPLNQTPLPKAQEKLSNYFIPGKKGSFLLEIGSEELPATYVEKGFSSLEKQIKNLLNREAITYSSIKTYGTARRLSLVIKELSYGVEKAIKTHKGPSLEQSFIADGSLSHAGKGFLKGLAIEDITLEKVKANTYPELKIETVKDKEYLLRLTEEEARSTAQILQEELPKIILGVEFPKKMHWADLEIEYARPLRFIVALLDDQIIPFAVGNIVSSNQSWGHRQLDNTSFILHHADGYEKTLEAHKVLACPERRRAKILAEIKEIEEQTQCFTVNQEAVLNQVLYMSEWPQVTLAEFNKEFLAMPAPVAISEMIEHQKYFPLNDQNGTLTNQCLLTLDTNCSEEIIKGNTRVLSARLKDGVFLFKKGGKNPLENYIEKLKKITYMEGLGSMYDKLLRLVGHAEVLQQDMRLSTAVKVNRAARLCKCDLATEMVNEFPHLQGVIGRAFAEQQGEDKEVCLAIEEHWMPLNEHAAFPTSATGTLLSMADKLDNLLSCFAVGKEPTSSSDPHGLRRQAIAFLKMLLLGKHHISIKKLLSECAYNFLPSHMRNPTKVIHSVEAYLQRRLMTVFTSLQLSQDEVDASLSSNCDNPYATFCKIKALNTCRLKNHEVFIKLQEVHKRAKGQLHNQPPQLFSKELLQDAAEKELYEALESILIPFKESITKHDYEKSYELISTLQKPLENVFDHVKILCEDVSLQKNRLALLQKVFHLFDELLDFSKLTHDKKRS
jgi:glycyl-tRNA synthetase